MLKRFGELFELVAGMDGDAMVERPGADPRGAGVELADRSGHAAGEEKPGEHRNGEPEPEHETGIQQRSVKRRQRLADRLLDKDEPAELWDRRRRAQYPMAIEIADDRRRLGGLRPQCRAPQPPAAMPKGRYCAIPD